jgi:hypothetical protein
MDQPSENENDHRCDGQWEKIGFKHLPRTEVLGTNAGGAATSAGGSESAASETKAAAAPSGLPALNGITKKMLCEIRDFHDRVPA